MVAGEENVDLMKVKKDVREFLNRMLDDWDGSFSVEVIVTPVGRKLVLTELADEMAPSVEEKLAQPAGAADLEEEESGRPLIEVFDEAGMLDLDDEEEDLDRSVLHPWSAAEVKSRADAAEADATIEGVPVAEMTTDEIKDKIGTKDGEGTHNKALGELRRRLAAKTSGNEDEVGEANEEAVVELMQETEEETKGRFKPRPVRKEPPKKLSDEDIPENTVLGGVYKGEARFCVKRTVDGVDLYMNEDGSETWYTISGAAKAACGGTPMNGFRFFRMNWEHYRRDEDLARVTNAAQRERLRLVWAACEPLEIISGEEQEDRIAGVKEKSRLARLKKRGK